MNAERTPEQQFKREKEFEFHSTNEEQIRLALDYYLSYIQPELLDKEKVIAVDTSSGLGAYSKILLEFFRVDQIEIHQIEVREECQEYLEAIPSTKTYITDFLKWDHGKTLDVDLIAMNPPYSLAQNFLNHCRIWYKKVPVLANLPLSFMATIKRQSFINDPRNRITGVLVSGKRYPFGNMSSKSPSFDTGHFCWNTPEFGIVNV